MNRRIAILLVVLIASFSAVVSAEKIDEIKQYFELRDTIGLVNLEMKRVLAPDSNSSMLTEPDAEQDLTRLILFIEQRIKSFSSKNAALRLHYTRNLNNIFNETRYLYANVLVKIRKGSVQGNPVPVLQHTSQPITASEALELQDRPYFKPIDLRVLMSPSLLKEEDLKKAESVWANQMNAQGEDTEKGSESDNSGLFNKTPVLPTSEADVDASENSDQSPKEEEKIIEPVSVPVAVVPAPVAKQDVTATDSSSEPEVVAPKPIETKGGVEVFAPPPENAAKEIVVNEPAEIKDVVEKDKPVTIAPVAPISPVAPVASASSVVPKTPTPPVATSSTESAVSSPVEVL